MCLVACLCIYLVTEITGSKDHCHASNNKEMKARSVNREFGKIYFVLTDFCQSEISFCQVHSYELTL